MAADYRLLAFETLADFEAALRAEVRTLEDRVVDVVLEAQSYRGLAQAAIHALHALTVDHGKLRQKHDELDEECRRVREHLLREAGVTP